MTTKLDDNGCIYNANVRKTSVTVLCQLQTQFSLKQTSLFPAKSTWSTDLHMLTNFYLKLTNKWMTCKFVWKWQPLLKSGWLIWQPGHMEHNNCNQNKCNGEKQHHLWRFQCGQQQWTLLDMSVLLFKCLHVRRNAYVFYFWFHRCSW